MWDGTWDPSRTVSFTTFACGAQGIPSSSGRTDVTNVSSSKASVSATGYADGPGSVSATGYAGGPGSLSATGYAAEISSTIAPRPIPPPTNTLTYYMGAGASPQGGGNPADQDCAGGTGDGPNYVQDRYNRWPRYLWARPRQGRYRVRKITIATRAAKRLLRV